MKSDTKDTERKMSSSHLLKSMNMGARDDASTATDAAALEEGRGSPSMISKGLSFVVTRPSMSVLVIVAAGYFISGICQSISTKLQNRVKSPPGPDLDTVSFSNPFWQTMVMFLAEALCYPCYLIDEWWRKRNNKRLGVFEFPNSVASINKPPSPWYLWALPAACDLIGISAANWALGLTYASTVQVIRNSTSIWTAVGTLVILRKPLRVHQWLGTLLSTGGMIATGIWAMTKPDQSASEEGAMVLVGVLSALVSSWLGALHMVLEERFFRTGYIAPLKGVGIQGLTGIPMTIVAIIIVHYAGWFSITESWYQFKNSGVLIGGNIWYFIVTAIANACGLATTKLTSSLVRSVLFACRSPTVWIIEMIIRWSSYDHANLIALILIFLGFFVFILRIPGITKSRTPGVYRTLRKGVPCFCTRELPASDEEDNVKIPPKDGSPLTATSESP